MSLACSIFISYRRSDTGGYAGRLFDRLRTWFDEEQVFFDLASIDVGESFPAYIAASLDTAKVVLAVIGPDWLSSLNERAAKSEFDYVRTELSHALRRKRDRADLLIVPVLMGGALIPAPSDLAESIQSDLRDLFDLNAHEITGNQAVQDGQFEELREFLLSVDGISNEDDISAVRITSIDEVMAFRDIISPIADVDFFINLRTEGEKYSEDKIATVIKGVNYRKEITKYHELKNQASRDLETLKKQGKQIKRHLAGLEAKALWKNPGNPPTKPFFGSSNSAEEQAIYQQKMDTYRFAQRNYEAIRNEIDDAKKHYNRTTQLFDQKSHELETQIRQQEAQVCTALDLDILVFISEITRRADQSVNYDRNYFEGFVLVYFAKKTLLLLREYITGADAKYKSQDAHDRLEDEFNTRIFMHKKSVREGLDIAAKCCVDEIIMRLDRSEINSLLEQIPAQQNVQHLAEAEALTAHPFDFGFPFDPEVAVDPANVDRLKEYLGRRETEFAGLCTRMRDLVQAAHPILDTLTRIRSSCEAILARMIKKEQEEKQREQDLLFVLSVFDKNGNNQVLRKYARWLTDVEQEFNEEYDIQLGNLASGAVSRKRVVQDTVLLVRDSERWRLLECEENLERRRSQLAASLQDLRDKTEFAFALSGVRSKQEENVGKKNKRLKRSSYRQLIAEGRQTNWNREQIDRAITPYVPRSLFVPVVATVLVLGLFTTILTFFFNNLDKFIDLDNEERIVSASDKTSQDMLRPQVDPPQNPGEPARDDENALPGNAHSPESDKIQSSYIQNNEENKAAELFAQETGQDDLSASDTASETTLENLKEPHEIIRDDGNASLVPPEMVDRPEPEEDQSSDEQKDAGNKAADLYADEPSQDLGSSDHASEESLQLEQSQIAEIEDWLQVAGHRPGLVNGNLDKDTRTAIRRYQRSFGGEKTGYLNRALISALESENQLRLDKEGRYQVQRWLKDAGHDPGDIDGDFGPKTREAIRSYQRSLGTEATGILNREDLLRLEGKR